MQFGLQLNSQHPMAENMREGLEELLDQICRAQGVGFGSIVAPQHYLSAPFQMLQPFPLLARMASEANKMRLSAGILLLSLHNPVAPHPLNWMGADGDGAVVRATRRVDTLRDQRFIIGSPNDCVEQLLRYHERLGSKHFLLRVQWADIPQERVLEAVELFGERVIPRLRDV